jgi:hypothetical protein
MPFLLYDVATSRGARRKAPRCRHFWEVQTNDYGRAPLCEESADAWAGHGHVDASSSGVPHHSARGRDIRSCLCARRAGTRANDASDQPRQGRGYVPSLSQQDAASGRADSRMPALGGRWRIRVHYRTFAASGSPAMLARTMRRSLCIVATLVIISAASCKTAELSGGGAQVATSQSAPVDSGWDPESCESLGYVVGRGGGSFGGAWISNEELITYAMNDLRNQAAELGANFVQHDTPTMGQTGSENGSNTTTATVSGTAYSCKRKAAKAPAAPTLPPRPAGCTPGSTQACVGPGGCKGGQACVADGSGYSPCDCGPAPE